MLKDAVQFAEQCTTIEPDEKSIICHVRKSLLYSESRLWTKKPCANMFDVTVGLYGGAEICELIGMHILNILKQ